MEQGLPWAAEAQILSLIMSLLMSLNPDSDPGHGAHRRGLLRLVRGTGRVRVRVRGCSGVPAGGSIVIRITGTVRGVE